MPSEKFSAVDSIAARATPPSSKPFRIAADDHRDGLACRGQSALGESATHAGHMLIQAALGDQRRGNQGFDCEADPVVVEEIGKQSADKYCDTDQRDDGDDTGQLALPTRPALEVEPAFQPADAVADPDHGMRCAAPQPVGIADHGIEQQRRDHQQERVAMHQHQGATRLISVVQSIERLDHGRTAAGGEALGQHQSLRCRIEFLQCGMQQEGAAFVFGEIGTVGDQQQIGPQRDDRLQGGEAASLEAELAAGIAQPDRR